MNDNYFKVAQGTQILGVYPFNSWDEDSTAAALVKAKQNAQSYADAKVSVYQLVSGSDGRSLPLSVGCVLPCPEGEHVYRRDLKKVDAKIEPGETCVRCSMHRSAVAADSEG